MGEKQLFQPLTREDKITVALYRVGIVLSAFCMGGLAFLLMQASADAFPPRIGPSADILVYGLQTAVGMCVFFIHLYVGVFKKYLKNLYFISLGCLAVLVFIGKGSVSTALVQFPASALFLLPLSGCLGFVTAKEAFCFRLLEGYVLAMVMPLYLVFVSAGAITGQTLGTGMVIIAALLVFFTLRKAFMPFAYDIGDKSAYR